MDFLLFLTVAAMLVYRFVLFIAALSMAGCFSVALPYEKAGYKNKIIIIIIIIRSQLLFH